MQFAPAGLVFPALDADERELGAATRLELERGDLFEVVAEGVGADVEADVFEPDRDGAVTPADLGLFVPSFGAGAPVIFRFVVAVTDADFWLASFGILDVVIAV